jgi:3-dehydroquinate synthase
MRIEQTITVQWRHQVHLTRGIFRPANPLLRQVLAEGAIRPLKALMVVDASLAAACPALAGEIAAWAEAQRPAVELVCPPVILPGGEQVKNDPEHVHRLHALIDQHHLDRQSCLLCLGGGALLDMAGFAAATAHRGIRHLRLPTTTLAQADSGVGVKNAINAFGKKNFVGTFAPPFAVINDFDFLAFLPPRDRRAGMVEAVKVACIKDREFFETLERDADALARLETAPLEHLIQRCAQLHVEHIATGGDPFEMGSARPLDFGHWAAHKLEQLSQFRLRHGEAVAIGIAVDVLCACQMGRLSAPNADRILTLLERLGFALFDEELVRTDATGEWLILHGLEEFREHLGGDLAITIPTEIGQRMEVFKLPPEVVRQAISGLRLRNIRR